MMPLRESTHPPRTSVRFSASSAAGWSLVLVLTQALGGSVIRPSNSTGPIDFVSFGLVSLLALFVVLFGVVRVHGPDASLSEVMGLKETPLAFPPAVGPQSVWAHRAAVFACLAVAGVALVAVDAGLDTYFASRDSSYSEVLAKLMDLLAAPTTRAKVSRIVGLGIVQPFAELAFYFGIVFGGLRRPRSRVFACAMSLAFFVLHASDLRAAPIRLLLGAPLLLGRLATGSIIASLVTVLTFNVVEVVAVGRGATAVPGALSLWCAALVVVLLILAYLVRLASQWRLGEFADRLDMRA